MNTNSISQWMETNWKLILGLVAALCVVTGGWGVWRERAKSQELAATNMLFELQEQVRPLVEAKKLKEAEEKMSAVWTKYPSTRAAFEAQLQMGDHWMDAASYAEASKLYEMSAKVAKDSFSQVLAKYNMAIAVESAGKFQEAAQLYEEVQKLQGSDFLKPELMMAQARCLESASNVAKAVEVYQKIQKDFANRTFYSSAAAAFERLLSGGKQ